jgi:hypothetical protein
MLSWAIRASFSSRSSGPHAFRLLAEGLHRGGIAWLTWTFRATQNNHWCHARFSKEVASVLQEMGEDSVRRLADLVKGFCGAADSVR